MKMYPKRVCSKPVFTQLPPYIFSGAEFALIPSRDEPFGLVAVEFGRKGALGVGARVGGLGQMPGWWYTVESTTTTHLLKQFKEAIREAMSSSTETRAMMRARSAKQRFPVAQWVEDLEILQSTSIRIHDKAETDKRHSTAANSISTEKAVGLGIATPQIQHSPASSFGGASSFAGSPHPPLPDNFRQQIAHSRESSFGGSQHLPHPDTSRLQVQHSPESNFTRPQHSRESSFSRSQPPRLPDISGPQHPGDRAGSGLSRKASLGSRRGPGHVRTEDYNDGRATRGLDGGHNFLPPITDMDEGSIGRALSIYREYDDENDDDDANSIISFDDNEHTPPMLRPDPTQPRLLNRDSSTLGEGVDAPWPLSPTRGTPPQPQTPDASTGLFPPPRIFSDGSGPPSPNRSMVSVDLIVGEKTDYNLQKVRI